MGSALDVEPVGDSLSPLPSALPTATPTPAHMHARSLSENKQTRIVPDNMEWLVTVPAERAKMQAAENVFHLVGNGEPFDKVQAVLWQEMSEVGRAVPVG